jgi:hypothetical protein|uniref:hypothetical protein n=1 Tax=Limnohabitans sp. TaxID=1907725 RepID=UPI0040477C98
MTTDNVIFRGSKYFIKELPLDAYIERINSSKNFDDRQLEGADDFLDEAVQRERMRDIFTAFPSFKRKFYVARMGRGYTCEWEITRQRLYLKKINHLWHSDGSQVSIRDIFLGAKSKVFANWFSGQITLHQMDPGQPTHFSAVTALVLEGGVVLNSHNVPDAHRRSKYKKLFSILLPRGYITEVEVFDLVPKENFDDELREFFADLVHDLGGVIYESLPTSNAPGKQSSFFYNGKQIEIPFDKPNSQEDTLRAYSRKLFEELTPDERERCLRRLP